MVKVKSNTVKGNSAWAPGMLGFPGGASGKEPACQFRRYKLHGSYPYVGRIPWRKAWQPTSVFLPVESQWKEEPDGLHSIGSHRVGQD